MYRREREMFSIAILFTLYTSCYSLAWTENYIEAVLESRKCLNNSYTAIIDSLFVSLNDMSLVKLHYARGLELFMSRKIEKGAPLCVTLQETCSFIYRDILFARNQAIRRLEETTIYDPVRDDTLQHIQKLLADGVVRSQCAASVSDEKRHLPGIQYCFKERRKEAIRVYSRYS